MTGPDPVNRHADDPPEGAGPPRPAPGRPSTARRTALLAAVAGAALTGVAALQPWASGAVTDQVTGRRPLSVTGTVAAPTVLLLAAVGVAGAFASAISGRVLRVAAGVAMLLAGLAAALVAARLGGDPAGALVAPAAASTGRTGARLEEVTSTAWPWLAASGALVLAVAGALVVRGGPAWSGSPRRFERAAEVRAGEPPRVGGPVDRRDVTDDWERLSRDEDPTS